MPLLILFSLKDICSIRRRLLPGHIRHAVFCLSMLLAFTAESDWLNLTGAETAPNIAEIYVLDDHVKVQIEISAGDLETFADLIPDDWIRDMNLERAPAYERLANFSNHVFVVKTDSGEPLHARVDVVEARMRIDRRSPLAGMMNPYTGRRNPDAPADKRVVYVEIIYPFEGQPGKLQFIPPLDENGTPRVTIGFIAYHRSVPIIDFRYLGQPATLNLNWQDPWYTAFENRNLTRHHKYPLMLYLYVEPRRVRLESLMRVGDLAEMSGFNPAEWKDNASRYARMQDHVKAFIQRASKLDIDGRIQKPDEVSISYFTVGLFGLEPVINPEAIDDTSLLVGVSGHYYVNALPQRIQSTWRYFNPRVDKIPFVEIDPAGPLPGFIYEDDPEFGWNNSLKKYEEPVMRPLDVTTGWRITLPFVGEKTLINRPPDEQQARQIVGDILENLRVAWVEKHPQALSRELEKVLSQNSPDSLANELSLLYATAMKRGGFGAIREFGDFELSDIRPLKNPDGFSTTITGTASIRAMHWGHTDLMVLQFQLLLDLVEENHQWRVADLTVIDLKELK